MTKFLRKVFLFGILLSSVNYELAYSSTPGQFNIAVDFDKNEASTDNNELNTNMDIQYNNTIGKYDTDKYEIKDNILQEKEEKVFCELNPDANNYEFYLEAGVPQPPLATYIGKTTYEGIDYYVFPIGEFGYSLSNTGLVECNGQTILYNNRRDIIFSSIENSLIFTNNMLGINIMGVKIGDIYKISGNNIVYAPKIAKYSTKSGETNMKWYKTDEDGNLPADSKDYEPLNKAIFTITSDGELTLSESGGGGTTILEVTNFGQLVNSGKLILNDKTSILGSEIILGNETNEWNKSISNLKDVAIDNSNGTIVLKSGSTIDDIVDTKSDPVGTDNDPIIKGGTIDISDLLNWTTLSWDTVDKNNDKDININSAFYNTKIKLLPDKYLDGDNEKDFITHENFNTILNYFNNPTNTIPQLFKNMKFFSDIKDGNGNVTEARHSTVSMPGALGLSGTTTTNKEKYNTEKQVILQASFNSDNVLKLFYETNDITDEFKTNPPLVVDSATLNVSLYELLSDPASYISSISVSGKILSADYGLDLIPFVKNDKNVIDYSKFNENGNTNLDKIQFVSDKDSTDNLDLTLHPSYVMDGKTKVENTTIDMKSTYDGWKGIITPTSNKIKLSTGTYIIKAHEYMSIETEGDVNLYLDNEGKLSLCELSNNNDGSNNLSVFQYNYKNGNDTPLIIRLLAKDYTIPVGNVTTTNAPIKVNFVKDDVMSTVEMYKTIKDLTNDYIKAKVTGATEDINTKYAAISDSSSGVESKLTEINKLLTEIEDPNSETDYAKYFKAIEKNGKIEYSTTGIKTYNEIKDIQNNLIKINKYKIEILENYVGVLNHYVSTVSEEVEQKIIKNKITKIRLNIADSILNQIKMLKNSYYNTTDTGEREKLAEEIGTLSE